MDLAGRSFWDQFWRRPAGRRFGHLSFTYRAFSAVLLKHAGRGAHACEIGCGASVWLPMLASRGVDAWGVDYSHVGVEIARAHARRAGVDVTIVEHDVFDQALFAGQRFDVIFSLGLLEHFEDSAPLASRFYDLCRPGGVAITLVPNFAGAWGRVQRIVDRDVYDVHRVYRPADLDRAHTDVGFHTVAPARYFGGIGPLVVNYSRLLGRLPPVAGQILFGGTWVLQQALCWTTALLPRALSNPPYLAAHIVGVYRRPE